MVSLLDIAPLTECVAIGSQALTVAGVSAKGIVALLARFPQLQALVAGGDLAAGTNRFGLGADAVAAVIAAGCGHPGDAQAEAVAASLPVDAQADLLTAIVRLTMPAGIGPFVEKLSALGAVLGMTPAAN